MSGVPGSFEFPYVQQHKALSEAVPTLGEVASVRFKSMNPVENDQSPSRPRYSSMSEAERQIRSLTAARPSSTGRRTASRHGDDSTTLAQDPGSEISSLSSHIKHPNSEAAFKERALEALDQSRPLAERITAAIAIAKELKAYSADTLMSILLATKDLADQQASSDARKASLSLLQASSTHTGLGPAERADIYSTIAVPIDPVLLEQQIQALRGLTQDGQHLEPFTKSLASYLYRTLNKQYDATTEARRRLKAVPTENRSKDRLSEERGLGALLDFTVEVILTNPEAITGPDLNMLTSTLILVAEKTPSQRDMKKASQVIQAILQVSRIPEDHIKTCVELLCAIITGVKAVADMTWESFLLLVKSPDQSKVIIALQGVVAASPQDRNHYTVCGALLMIKFLFSNNGAGDLPVLTFQQLIDSLWQVHTMGRRVRRECLRTIASILEDQIVAERVLHEDWAQMIRISLMATGDDTYTSKTLGPSSLLTVVLSAKDSLMFDVASEPDNDLRDNVMTEIQRIAEAFVPLWEKMCPTQRTLAASYLYKLRRSLSTSALAVLINQISEEGLLSPKHIGWKSLQMHLVDIFLLNSNKDHEIRRSILFLLGGTISQIRNDNDLAHFRMLTLKLIWKLRGERDLHVNSALVDFLALYLDQAEQDDFAIVVDNCLESLSGPHSTLSETDISSLASSSGVTSTDSSVEVFSSSFSTMLVKIFISNVQISAVRSRILYSALIETARHEDISAPARIIAMKLLMRLRCNQSHAIMITNTPDSLGLAGAVSRIQPLAATSPDDVNSERASLHEDYSSTRVGRASLLSQSSQSNVRASIRSVSGPDRSSRPVLPLWMYPGSPGLPQEPSQVPSSLVYQYTRDSDEDTTLRISSWLEVVIHILQKASNWEIYSYIVVHLPSQLSNVTLFSNAIPHIQLLRNVLVSQLQSGKIFEPPAYTGAKKGDVAYCLYQTLTILLGYSDHFARGEQDDVVRTLLLGITNWDRTTKICIHGLAICCHVVPDSITRYVDGILQKMTQIITQTHLVMDILEFLGGLARLPEIYVNFTENEYRTVFAICVRYLESSREKRLKLLGGPGEGANYTSNRSSVISTDSASTLPGSSGLNFELNQNTDVHKDLPQYVFALAYHVLAIWFLSLKLLERPQHVGWISRNLAWKDPNGSEIMEEQSQVMLDMMYRTTYLDLGETLSTTNFQLSDGKVLRKSWLLGLSIVTVETAVHSGLTQLTKRQASGTTYATYQQTTKPLPPHHVPAARDTISSMYGPESRINILPNHVFLQLSSNIAPTPTPMEAICLPDDDMTKRAIASFDRNDTVDGYKIGVIYVGGGQSEETEILANTQGSKNFEGFLEGLGTKVELKDAAFNTQGLDRQSDQDGTHTYAWRDRVAEIVYHVPTMMPTNLEEDSQCVNKKRHIGNDFVNIIFNESGKPYKFDTFPSQFNYVNIVINPDALPVTRKVRDDNDSDNDSDNDDNDAESNPRYTIQTQRQSSFPVISPAASYKLVALKHLPSLARQLALNASVFSNVWANREGGEYVSSWRNRLREIVKLRARHANTGASTSAKFPGAKGTRTYQEGDKFVGVVAMGGLAEEEGVLASLDFSRWAGPNPSLA